MTSVEEVLVAFEQIIDDEDVPKSVAAKINFLVNELKHTKELSLTVNKGINELEELSEDVNIPPFIRTQIWSIISQLAALETAIVNN